MPRGFPKHIFALAILLSSILALLIPIPTLIVYVNGELTMMTPLMDRVETQLSFVHSSELAPWTETWIINSDGIFVKEVCWGSGGAGYPTMFSDFSHKVELVAKGDVYCYEGVDRALGKSLVIDSEHAINMSIVIAGREIPRGVVRIVVAQEPIAAYLSYILRKGAG